jgi:hypothetical protein
MSKKIYIPIGIAIMLAMLAGLWVSNTALAKAGGPGGLLRRPKPELGKVTLVAEEQFTIQRRDATELTILVDENTRFIDREKNEMTFADVKTGRWVAVAAPEDEAGKRVARLVVILPEDFDPAKMERLGGRITSIITAAKQFVMQNRQGEDFTINTDEETLFRGEATDLASLQEGWLAGALVLKQDDGSLLAQTVRAGSPILKKAGEITAVDDKAGTLTLKPLRGGEEITFAVDADTRFRSRDGSLKSLADLKVGMVGLVVAKAPLSGADEGTHPVAVLVAAIERNKLPKFDQRIGGKIVSVDKSAFTIEARDGKQYTFQVTGDTLFRSRGSLVQKLEDLKAGMIVMVGANELGSGQYQAQLVIAIMRIW